MLNRPLKVWQALVLAGALAAGALAVTGAHGQSSARGYIKAKSFDVPAHSVAGAQVLCEGRGNLALGGGIQVQDPSAEGVRSTYPFDDDDANARPEDGWTGQVKNDGDRTQSATVYVTCG